MAVQLFLTEHHGFAESVLFVTEHHRVSDSIDIDTEHNDTNHNYNAECQRNSANGAGMPVAIGQQLHGFDRRIQSEAVQGDRL